MCGIIGCISRENCYEKLLSSLARLEYRGYDSAGVCLLSDSGTLRVRKKKGYVSNLAGKPIPGGAGIGHTRWATHGKPSDENAHPHLCGKFALVHNGIIENYAALKEELLAQGDVFLSETDSEVIVHLLSHAYRGDFLGALREVCARLCGSYALAVLCADYPGQIAAARRGSPLVAGAAKGALYVCSDVPALCGEAEFLCPVEDGEFVLLSDAVRVFDGQGRQIERSFTRVKSEQRAASVAEGTFMQAEIAQVPRALRDTLEGLEGTDFAPCARALRGAKRVWCAACGTAYHAALSFADVLAEEGFCDVFCTTSSEFRYKTPLIGAEDVFVAVSQSGETADTLEAARLAKSRGAFLIGITNVADSSLSRLVHFNIAMRAGPEIAVAATKSYNAQLLCLFYLAAQLVFFKKGSFPPWKGELRLLPERAEECFGTFGQMSALAAKLISAKGMFFLGRNADFPTALEGALKVREIACLFAEGYPAGELKHGSLALVEEGFPVFALSTREALFAKTENALAEVRARGAYTILLSQSEQALSQSCAHRKVLLPKICAPLYPVLSVLPLQYFACRLSLLRGMDPDKPRNLAKSVTVE